MKIISGYANAFLLHSDLVFRKSNEERFHPFKQVHYRPLLVSRGSIKKIALSTLDCKYHQNRDSYLLCSCYLYPQDLKQCLVHSANAINVGSHVTVSKNGAVICGTWCKMKMRNPCSKIIKSFRTLTADL